MFGHSAGGIVILSDIVLTVPVLFHVIVHPGKGLQFDSMGKGNRGSRKIIATLRSHYKTIPIPDIGHPFQPGRQILFLGCRVGW